LAAYASSARARGTFPDARSPEVSGEGQCAEARQELGVYLVGAIAPAQRAWVDCHLATCPRCRAELAELAGLPALLRKIPAIEVTEADWKVAGHPAPGPPLSALLDRMSRTRRRWRLTAAAAFLAVITAVAGFQLVQPDARPPVAAVTRWALTASAGNPLTQAWAIIRYTGESSW
jgi:anti-sigma factor RsiW